MSRITYSSKFTYLYRFDFDSPDFNHYRILKCGKEVRGAGHADDMSYIFFNTTAWKLDKDSPELQTIQRMIGIFVAFAETADPNCKEIEPILWEPLEKKESFKCLNISTNLDFINLPELEKLKIWDSFYTKEQLY